MPSTNPHSIAYNDAKQMIDEYRRYPRPIVGSEDSQGQLIQLDELSFSKSALQVFVGVPCDSIRIFFAVDATGRDSSGNLTFPQDPAKQTYTAIIAGVKDGAIVHSTALDKLIKGPPHPIVNP
jgi:hypothetical protein